MHFFFLKDNNLTLLSHTVCKQTILSLRTRRQEESTDRQKRQDTKQHSKQSYRTYIERQVKLVVDSSPYENIFGKRVSCLAGRS